MRVAFIFESTSANYTEDLLVGGLRALYGERNVAYWPEKPHLTAPVPSAVAPEGSCWIGGRSGAVHTILSEIASYDLLLVGNPNAPGHADYASRCTDAALAAGVPVGCIDGNDFPNMEQLEMLLPDGPWFVREHRSGLDPRAIPLPFSVNPVTLPAARPWADRTVDILWGGTPHYGRPKYVEALREYAKRSPLNIQIVDGRALGLADWNALLTMSRACLCLKGAGAATYRYFECGGAGVIPLVEEHELVIPDDYVGPAAPRFIGPERMVEMLDFHFVERKGRLLQHMAEEAYEQVWTSHTAAARAAQVVAAAVRKRLFG